MNVRKRCLIVGVLAISSACGPRGSGGPSEPNAAAPGSGAEAPSHPPSTTQTATDQPQWPDATAETEAPVASVERVYSLLPAPSAPKQGPDDAKVTLEVCSDFECPFCAQLVPTLHTIVENYGDLVRVVWHNCPLPFHEQALPAAEAAREVYEQAGDAAFWAYHDRLFAHQRDLSVDALVTHADAIEGVDPAQVRLALVDHRHAPKIREELQALVDSGAASGGFGTPATFVNGRLIPGAQPYRVFEDAIERALQETPAAHAAAVAASKEAYPMARVRHILIQYQGAQGADKDVTRSKQEARALAERLRTQMTSTPAEMASLARKHSDCPSAVEGGELGKFTRGELVPEFETALFALAPGALSEVVETRFGFHVILREE